MGTGIGKLMCDLIGHDWRYHTTYAKRTCPRCGLIHFVGLGNEWGTKECHNNIQKYFK